MSHITSTVPVLRRSIARSLQISHPKPSSSSSSPRIRPFSEGLSRLPRSNNYICRRCLHNTRNLNVSSPPKSRDRGPASKEDTQTDFGALNVLGGTPPPATSIDATTNDGFAFSNNTKISGTGVMLVSGEVFRWRPWVREKSSNDVDGVQKRTLLNAKGQWDVDETAWGVLDIVWPKPDLLIIGTGASIIPISPATRKHINDLGIRIEVQDTRNAAAQFNLLATERGVQQVAAALIPTGWKEGR
ncbi:hypothetical protein E6O75_ATG08996 [Venturia nashicola]|uniref:NADH dehydrogenase [ubiquinone] 1 alpha subcomplex assembly factor 3 n=1 Tax=Venturia nashicola TaxID=86259 RepID=A0A4Z1P2U6_9PEZI|nr:hypothetical protein E6O75_ATG08996 [Venturia nashicola]